MAPRRPARRPASGPDAPAPAERLVVALVRGLRGLRGHVRVELLTDTPEERFGVGATLYREGSTRGADHRRVRRPSPTGPAGGSASRRHPSREAAEALRDLYLEIDKPDEPREPGRWLLPRARGARRPRHDRRGARHGSSRSTVQAAPRCSSCAARAASWTSRASTGIVTDLAPERGEMIVDLDVLDLDARPVDDEQYVRPRERRPPNPSQSRKPKGRRSRRRATGPVRKPAPHRLRARAAPPRPAPDAARGRRPHAVPADGRGAAAARASRRASRSAASPPSASTTCAGGASGEHRTVDDYTYGGGSGHGPPRRRRRGRARGRPPARTRR